MQQKTMPAKHPASVIETGSKSQSLCPIVFGIGVGWLVGQPAAVLLVTGGIPYAWQRYLESLADQTSYQWWQWPWGLHGAKLAERIVGSVDPVNVMGSWSLYPHFFSISVRLITALEVDAIIAIGIPLIAANLAASSMVWVALTAWKRISAYRNGDV